MAYLDSYTEVTEFTQNDKILVGDGKTLQRISPSNLEKALGVDTLKSNNLDTLSIPTLSNILPNSTKTYTVDNGTRAVIALLGTYSDIQNILTLASSSSGTVIYKEQSTSSDLIISRSTNSITIENKNSSNTVFIHALIFKGSITDKSSNP